MALNTEHQLTSIVEHGEHKLLRPIINDSRIVLSRLKRAYGELKSCNGYGLFIPLIGDKVYHTDEEKFSLAPGQFLLLDHHQNCILDHHTQTEALAINIRVHQSFIEQALYTYRNSTETLLDNPYDNQTYEGQFYQGVFRLDDNQLGRYLADVVSKLDVYSDELWVNETELFHQAATSILLLQQQITDCTSRVPAKKTTTQKELFRRLNRAKMMIDDNLSSAMNITTLSKESSLSESHFLRSYKSMFGMSPYQYLLQRKVEAAAVCLQNSKESLTNIAFQLGFADLSSFSKSFKKVKGVSPAAFRKMVSC